MNDTVRLFAMTHKWYEQYERLGDETARRFIEYGIELLPDCLGSPAVRIQTVHLCRSIPRQLSPHLKRNFQLCELVDEPIGEFAIYLSGSHNAPISYGQLGHEVGHLRNAKVYDAYAEGLCTWFSRELAQEAGHDWDAYEKHFASGAEPFYATTYKMIRELEIVVGRGDLWRLFGFTAPFGANRLSLDTEAWLGSLTAATRARARATVAEHRAAIEAHVPDGVAFAPLKNGD